MCTSGFHSYLNENKCQQSKTDVHILVWRATQTIQYARRFFYPYLDESKKINNQFLIEIV